MFPEHYDFDYVLVIRNTTVTSGVFYPVHIVSMFFALVISIHELC